MIDDLQLVDLVYAVVGMACFVGLLILRTRPPAPPVSASALRRLNEHIDEQERCGYPGRGGEQQVHRFESGPSPATADRRQR